MSKSKVQLSSYQYWLLAAILLLAAGLRLYQLGTDDYWVDEVGVVLVTQTDSLSEMLRAARSHVMAMPLDYLSIWLLRGFGEAEGFLRLPAATWGTLSVLASFLLFRRLSGEGIGLLSALLLAIAPFHIQYSQELRFYAPLVFFYLLATWLLLRALQNPSIGSWLALNLTLLIGLLFHIYVVLAVINGLLWAWLTPSYRVNRGRLYMARSLIVILLAVLIAVLLFGSVYNSYDIPLLLDDSSIPAVLAIGLGWLPFYPPVNPLVYLSGAAVMLLAMGAILVTVRNNPRGLPALLFYSLLAQLAAIFALNIAKGYFLAPRHFVLFLPLMLYYSALGIQYTAYASARWLQKPAAVNSLQVILTGFILVAAVPALANYYQGDKGQVTEITRFLEENLEAGEAVWVIPDYEYSLFFYYASRLSAASQTSGALTPGSWQALRAALGAPTSYVVAPYPPTFDQQGFLEAAGFRLVFASENISRYSRAVWEYIP